MEVLTAVAGGLPVWTLSLVFPLVFLAGFVDAIGGGGGLISLPAFLIAGLPPHLALGTNKLQSSLGTAVATFKYARNGYMEWRLCGLGVAAALAGSYLGARLMLGVDETVLTVFMLVALPVVGFYVIRRKNLVNEREPFAALPTALLVAAVAFAVGVYDGFYGPGTGTFLILLLTGAVRLSVFKAAGVTKVINLTTNVTALVVFLANGTVLLGLGLACGAFNIAGNYLGARLFADRGARIVRPIILVVLVIFAARLAAQLLGLV